MARTLRCYTFAQLMLAAAYRFEALIKIHPTHPLVILFANLKTTGGMETMYMWFLGRRHPGSGKDLRMAILIMCRSMEEAMV